MNEFDGNLSIMERTTNTIFDERDFNMQIAVINRQLTNRTGIFAAVNINSFILIYWSFA